MIVVVDANIIFSGILNSKGKIGDLLINFNNQITFISPEFLRQEIKAKYKKLQLISNLDIEQIKEAEYHICKHVNFISEEQISDNIWKEAYDLMQDIDIKDVQYVAYSKQFDCKIWSGDKKLFKGLNAKGFNNIITTDDLYKSNFHC